MEPGGDGPDRPDASEVRDGVPVQRSRPLLRLVPPPPPEEKEEGPKEEDEDPLARAYGFAREILAAHPPQLHTPGYRLFWVHGNDLGWKDVPAGPEDYAVLGCHVNADLRLPESDGVALRHLLATATVLADGSVALRLLDLHTSRPFLLDGQERLSVCISGPLLCRLGGYVLGGLPLGPVGDPQEIPRYTTSESIVPPSRSLQVGPMSHVTVLPRASTIDSLAAGPARPGHARVTLRGQGRASSVEISEPDLHAGVLIGRSEACLDRGLRSALNGHISRVHLLLLMEHGRVYAFDLCSTNGTRVDGRRVRGYRLPDAGATLLLAGRDEEVILVWHPRRQGSGLP